MVLTLSLLGLPSKMKHYMMEQMFSVQQEQVVEVSVADKPVNDSQVVDQVLPHCVVCVLREQLKQSQCINGTAITRTGLQRIRMSPIYSHCGMYVD